ncbi:MAG: hypothetical protein GXO43_04580 [Crenarchaeota archaeon]|nr:hypothetical protein [Thermoproteota archaeon]
MQPLIKSYSFGRIVVGDKIFTRDIIILPDKIISDWWRKEGHRLQHEDLGEAGRADADAVVIGTGYYGLMRVDREVVEYFRNKGLDVFVAETGRAVEKYNELVKQGKRVIALFHLTC